MLSPSDLEFFIYPFANSETTIIDYNPKAKDNKLGFQLLDDDLTGRNYIEDIEDKVGSSAASASGSLATTRQKLRDCFITHINDVPVFSTNSARAQLRTLYKRFKKRQEQGVDKDMKFKTTFARVEPMDGKKLKQAIYDYHDLTPGTIKRICDKYPDDDGDDDGLLFDLDNRTKRFDIGFPIYKVFDNKEYKGKIIGYNSQHQLYQIQYEDGDKEEFYHNKIHAHLKRTKSRRSTSDKKRLIHNKIFFYNSGKEEERYPTKISFEKIEETTAT